MRNKFFAACTAILLMLPASMQTEAAETFSDIGKHWAQKEIRYLSERHIIGGYPDGTFRPNEPITRAQASAMLIKALKLPLTENTDVQFKDVPKKSPYYRLLATVNEKGIMRGDNGYMRPGEQTSRAQMAAIIRRSFDLPLDKQATFIDVAPAHWAYQDVNGIAKQRIAGGSDGKYMPSDAVTRAQFSAFLVRALDDKMKLSDYHSYVSQRAKVIEQDGLRYTIENEAYTFGELTKTNISTGKKEILLSKSDFDRDGGIYTVHLNKGFPLIAYNDDLYIPYWSGVSEASDIPISYGIIKADMEKPGNPVILEHLDGRGMRNVFIWNDRIYFTKEQNPDESYMEYGFNFEKPQDSQLILYSAAMDGSGQRKETTFRARILFEDLSATPSTPNINQYNKSVLHDHSTVYYFNRSGVFAYDLLSKKTRKLSEIMAKDMRKTEKGLIAVDLKGKEHILK